MFHEQVSHGQLMPFSVQVMLLGFVLLGRSLEEKARIRASSDMNELLVSSNHFCINFCEKQLGCLLDSHVKSNSCDMNELHVSSNHFCINYCKKQLGCLLDSHVKSNSC